MTTKSDVTEPIIVERTFNAPVARVWTALTDVNEMRQWYFDLKEFKSEIGFELSSWSSMKAMLIITFAKSPR